MGSHWALRFVRSELGPVDALAHAELIRLTIQLDSIFFLEKHCKSETACSLISIKKDWIFLAHTKCALNPFIFHYFSFITHSFHEIHAVSVP